MDMNTNVKSSEVSKKSLADKLVESRQSNVDEFGGIEHRLELISNVKSVDYVNDSKATDVNSTWYSL